MEVSRISFGAKVGNIPNMKVVAGKKIPLRNAELKGYNAFIGGDVYMPSGKIEQHNLLFNDSKLIAIDDFEEGQIGGMVNYILLKDKTIAPAVMDEHIHGGYGVSFHNSNEEQIRALLKMFALKGIGGVLATTLPGTAEEIRNQIKVLSRIIENPDEGSTKIYGIHLEGPFLNPQKRGIHPTEKILKPTIENYESFEPEHVVMVTLAPELDKKYQLTKYLSEKGVIVSAGHSMASASQVRNSGIKQVTHIFNAMAGFHHRIPTIANEGLVNPEFVAEMNSDESLLIPQTMNHIMNTKPKDKLVLISDALPEAGIKEDFYMNGTLIHVNKNWVAKDDKNTLAGSMRFLCDIAKKITNDTNMTFRDFIQYSSANPAGNIGILNQFSIKEGLEPNFSVWNNKTIKHEKTFIN